MKLDQFKDVNLVIDKANDAFIPRQFVSQGDYKGRTLTVQITNNGSIGEVPGLTLNLNWHNEASGLTDLTAFTILDKTNSIFRIEYPENMMTPGKVYASIQIIQDGKVTNLKQFELIVQKLAGQPVGIAEKAEFSALVAVLADANKLRTDTDSYLKSITVVPKTFTNLAAIQSKYPNGANGVMVAADNGHKYIWANNVWTDAGVYQSAGIADWSIVPKKLALCATTPILYHGGVINTNTTTKMIEFPSGVIMLPLGDSMHGKHFDAQSISYNGITHWIVYDLTKEAFRIEDNPSGNNAPIGWVRGDGLLFINGEQTSKNGELITNAGNMAAYSMPLIYSHSNIIYDAKEQTLTFPKSFNLTYGGRTTALATKSNSGTIDDVISIPRTGFLMYDPNTKTIWLGGPSPSTVTLGYVDVGRKQVCLNTQIVKIINSKSSIKITYLGDSITAGVHTSKRYLDYIEDELTASKFEVTTVNLGIGGTCIADRTNGFISRWQDIPADSDVIVVFGGTNDYGNDVPMGDMTSDNTTFKGSLNGLITSIQNTYPNADLLVLTPIKRYFRNSVESWTNESTWIDGDKSKNNQKLLLSDYVDAVKEIAGYNGAKVIDLYHNSGFNPRVEANYNRNTTDGLHPNAVGHYLLYKQIYPDILNYAENRENVSDPSNHN